MPTEVMVERGENVQRDQRREQAREVAVLSYAMYTDSARSVNWGQTIGTDTVVGTGNGASQALTVYGSVPAGQYVAPGAYSDTITATVTY